MGIVDEDVRRVREATDLVALVGQHLQLRRVGRRWQGLCPFHQEKTPSFSVNPELGFYHCFGCQKSGDAITFVREVEGLDFVGAVEKLAARAGMSLRYTNRSEGETRRKRAQLLDAVAAAVDFYHERLLTGPDAGAARKYLRERGIDGDEVRQYRLGWAPDDWDALAKAIDVPKKVFTDAGLGFVNRRHRLQDSFRARILFPINDVSGNPVGFGGRKLPGAEGPKYKNSPESAIYAKSRLLYGLDRVKEHVVHADTVIVCEGYTDVMGFARAGLPLAVATCGTALTEDHVKLLKRFAGRIVLAFDADSAGQAAAERFYEWERDYEIDVRVAALPAGVDPADLAQTDPEALTAAVDEAAPFLAFRVDRLLGSADLATAEGRARAAEQAVGLVAEHPSALVRDQYLIDIAGRCRVDVATLRSVTAGAPATGRSATTVAEVEAPAGELPDSVEVQMLQLAIHRPDLVPAVVDPALFLTPLYEQVFTALLSADELHEAVASAGPEVSGVIQRLAVQEPDIGDQRSADRLAGRLVDQWASDVRGQIEAEAARSDNLEMGRQAAELQNAIAALRDGGWRIEDAERLLRWRTRPESDHE